MGGWTEYCVICGGPLAPNFRKKDGINDYYFYKWLDRVDILTEDNRHLRKVQYIGDGEFKYRGKIYNSKSKLVQGVNTNLCIAMHSMCSGIVQDLDFEKIWPKLGNSNTIKKMKYGIPDYQFAIDCFLDLQKNNKLWMIRWPAGEKADPGFKNRQRIANLWKTDKSVIVNL